MLRADTESLSGSSLGEGFLPWRRCALIALAAAALSTVAVLWVDGWIAAWAIELDPAVRRSPFFEGAEALGGAYGSFWLLGVLAWARKRPRALSAGLLALAICGVGVVGLKCAFGRGRPDRDALEPWVPSRAVHDYDDLSYPSGDAAQAFSLAFIAAAFLPRRWRWAPFALAALPALQRVVAARHFLGDVLGGLALGALCAALALGLEKRLAVLCTWRVSLRRARELAAAVAIGWCCLWFFAAGHTFAQLYVPVIALVLLWIKGPATLRWVGGTALGRAPGAGEVRRRLRIARGLGILLLASIALPPLAIYAPVDRVEEAFIRSLALGSAFLGRIGNATGWLLSAYFASRVAERLAGARAALLAMLVVGGAFEFAWLARWSGIEMLVSAALLLALEGRIGLRTQPRAGDKLRLALGLASMAVLLGLRNFLPTSPAEPLAWIVLRPDEFTNPALWSAPLWLLVALLPWPLWLLARRCRAACLRSRRGDKTLLGAVALGLCGSMLLGASAEFAATVAAAPLLLLLAPRLSCAPSRGLFATSAGMLVLAAVCIPFQPSFERVPLEARRPLAALAEPSRAPSHGARAAHSPAAASSFRIHSGSFSSK